MVRVVGTLQCVTGQLVQPAHSQRQPCLHAHARWLHKQTDHVVTCGAVATGSATEMHQPVFTGPLARTAGNVFSRTRRKCKCIVQVSVSALGPHY